MKKILFAVLITLLLLTAAVYFLIPQNITVGSEIKVESSVAGVQRITGDSGSFTKWLPKEGNFISGSKYALDGCNYEFGMDNFSNNTIVVRYKNLNCSSLLTVFDTGHDSVKINWRLNQQTGYNPLTRLSYYFKLKHIKQTNEKILAAMQAFLSSKKNVYGFNVSRQTQTDSTLITLKAFSAQYPTAAEIYENIEKLKQYAAVNGANTTNAPMFNTIEKDPTGKWLYMVALPIDKALENKGDIVAKRMFAGGKILITEHITGGTATINNAMQNFEKYKSDYGYMSPAIPFQSLVTDRMKETDTARWQTKLYYPVY